MRSFVVGEPPARALVVHGNDLCGEFYRGMANELAGRGIGCELVTLPGFHGVPGMPAPSWSGLADRIIDGLPHHRTVLIGHSMGGLLGLLVAAARPARLSHLVLLEPVVFPSRWIAKLAARRYLASVVRGQRDEFENWNGAARRVHDPAAYPAAAIELYLEVRRTSDHASAEALWTSLHQLYPLPYERIEVPALLVEGADAGWRGSWLRRRLRRQLKPRRVAIPGAGHWLANEVDRELADSIAEFVVD